MVSPWHQEADFSGHIVGFTINEGFVRLSHLVLVHGGLDLGLVEELLEAARDVLVVAEAHLAVEKVALQDGVGTSVKDLDEDSGDEVGEEEDDEEGCVG